MIDFEEELKKFEPSMEVKESEEAIRSRELTDMIDLLREVTTGRNGGNGNLR